MKIKIDVLRKKADSDSQYTETFALDMDDRDLAISEILREINLLYPDDPVEWESSCLQKKCGACAMVINGRPGLACNTKISDIRSYDKKAYKRSRSNGNSNAANGDKADNTDDIKEIYIRLEPLRKFPVVKDLIVDRSIMMRNLETIGLWMRDNVNLTEKKVDDTYESSMCLQCGCCLEVCPNFYPGGDFAGMAGFVPTARLIGSLPEEDQESIRRSYTKHIYNGCGKSLACRDICPAGIDIDGLLIRSNAIAIWKRK